MVIYLDGNKAAHCISSEKKLFTSVLNTSINIALAKVSVGFHFEEMTSKLGSSSMNSIMYFFDNLCYPVNIVTHTGQRDNHQQI